MYPARSRSADKLLKGLDALNKVGPYKKGTRPSALRKYRKARKEKAVTFVGPASPQIILPVATVAFWNNFGTKRGKARPFFTNMIEKNSSSWGTDMAAIMVEVKYDAKLTLRHMGELIKDQLENSINDWPADNAPLTVEIKGFNKGLIDKAIMLNRVGFQVIS